MLIPRLEYKLFQAERFAGFAVNAFEAGEATGRIIRQGTFSQRSHLFHPIMKQIENLFLYPLASVKVVPGSLNTILILLSHAEAHVRINKNPFTLSGYLRRESDPDQPLYPESFHVFEQVDFVETPLQAGQGVIFLCSHGFQRSVYINLWPEDQPDYAAETLPRELALMLNELLLEQDGFAPERFTALMAQQWFPFAALTALQLQGLQHAVAGNLSGGDLATVEAAIVAYFTAEKLGVGLQEWLSYPEALPLEPVITDALHHYLVGDYGICLERLRPALVQLFESLQQRSATQAQRPGALQQHFEIYFTRMHATEVSQKQALLALLVLDQLLLLIRPRRASLSMLLNTDGANR